MIKRETRTSEKLNEVMVWFVFLEARTYGKQENKDLKNRVTEHKESRGKRRMQADPEFGRNEKYLDPMNTS